MSAYHDVKFWKYLEKKKSFLLGNQSKYYHCSFSIDEVTREITCSEGKQIVARFSFEDIHQVLDSVEVQEGFKRPTLHGLSITDGMENVWDLFGDTKEVCDEWISKLNSICSKMQKLKQLSKDKSSSSLVPPSTPERRSVSCEDGPSALISKPRRRKSSVTFNFNDIDNKKSNNETEICGSNPMKASQKRSSSADDNLSSSRPEILKRMTAMNSVHNPHISISGSNRLKRSANKRSSDSSHNKNETVDDDGWIEKFSEKHQRKYWGNKITKETTWNDPRKIKRTSAPTVSSEKRLETESEKIAAEAELTPKKEGTLCPVFRNCVLIFVSLINQGLLRGRLQSALKQ